MTKKLYVSEDYLARRQSLAVTWLPPVEDTQVPEKPLTIEQARANALASTNALLDYLGDVP